MSPSLPGLAIQMQSAFGGVSFAVLADSLLIFTVALLLLTYLGAGVSAELLPQKFHSVGWMLAPFYGYSGLVALCGLLVAFGANVTASMAVAIILATAVNIWSLKRAHLLSRLGSPLGWVGFACLAAASYSVTAITMAHNGSLAYVGDQIDIYLLVPVTEWLKNHAAPLFSISSPWLLDPHWNGAIPPISRWSDPSSHLGYAGHRPDDALFLLQRGPRYFEAGLGVLLGWDALQTLRPTQAIMLSMAIPATYLFCRYLANVSRPASLVGAAIVGLNGVQFYWIMRVHPGQAVWAFLLPVALVVAFASLRERGLRSVGGTGLLLAGLLVSYYQGAPLLASLMMAGLGGLLLREQRRVWRLAQVAAMAMVTILLTLPEQLKLLLIWRTGALFHPDWRWAPAPLSDALGTTIESGALELVTGGGQAGELGMKLLQGAWGVGTAIALLLLAIALLDAWRHRDRGDFWLLAIGVAGLLLYLRFSSTGYMYSKAQAMATFIFAAGLALGVDGLFHSVRKVRQRGRRLLYPVAPVPVSGVGMLLLVLAVNLALSSYVFWKPVGNKWSLKAWDAAGLGMLLPAGTRVDFSPGVLGDPESTWATLYSLRMQDIGARAPLDSQLGEWLAQAIADLSEPADSGQASDCHQLLGVAEVPASWGFSSGDRIWSGHLVEAYRRPPGMGVAVVKVMGSRRSLPASLPAMVEIQSGEGRMPGPAHLVLTLAGEEQCSVDAVSTQGAISISVGRGVSMRAVPIYLPDRVKLQPRCGSRVDLLGAVVRTDVDMVPNMGDHPQLLALSGESTTDGYSINTRVSHIDIGVPVSISVTLHNVRDDDHVAWYELPLFPDNRLREVQLGIDGRSLNPQLMVDGAPSSRPFSAGPIPNGDYVAYITVWSGGRVIKRIPIYRYSLNETGVESFRSWPLLVVWDATRIPGS